MFKIFLENFLQTESNHKLRLFIFYCNKLEAIKYTLKCAKSDMFIIIIIIIITNMNLASTNVWS